jgi:ubiquinone/menaquinone biosynthesis C-methylase UbiE
MRMPILDHFAVIAPHYDRLAAFRHAERMAALLDLPPGATLLDAGGGTGRVAQHIGAQATRVIVLDVSLPMLVQAAAKPGLMAVQGEVERLPVAAGSMPRIVMVDAFHHLRDQERALSELRRVLAPRGRLIILEPDIRRLAVRLIALGEKLLLMRSRFRSGEEIASLARHLGLKVDVGRDGDGSVWIVAARPASD